MTSNYGTSVTDQFAADRLAIQNGILQAALTGWSRRDDSQPQPEVRRAANKAMDTIDVMLRELRELRARLVSEIRASDDAAAARADALLASVRAAG
jgi:hypothetical protein